MKILLNKVKNIRDNRIVTKYEEVSVSSRTGMGKYDMIENRSPGEKIRENNK